MPLTDGLMPVFDRNEVHETVVRAAPERVMRAVRGVTPEEIRFFRLLTWLRGFRRKRLRAMGLTGRDRGLPLLEVAKRGGFVELPAGDSEIVLGVIGRSGAEAGGVGVEAGIVTDGTTTRHEHGHETERYFCGP